MKKAKVKPYKDQTIYERIATLEQELKRLEKALPLYMYFKGVSRYRTSYIVEMRKLMAIKLLQEGYTQQEVSKILYVTHSTIIYLLSSKYVCCSKEVEIVVGLKHEEWITTRQYPVIKRKLVPDSNHKTGFTTVLDYYLKDLK
jgi:predicted transcriptional regulator